MSLYQRWALASSTLALCATCCKVCFVLAISRSVGPKTKPFFHYNAFSHHLHSLFWFHKETPVIVSAASHARLWWLPNVCTSLPTVWLLITSPLDIKVLEWLVLAPSCRPLELPTKVQQRFTMISQSRRIEGPYKSTYCGLTSVSIVS